MAIAPLAPTSSRAAARSLFFHERFTRRSPRVSAYQIASCRRTGYPSSSLYEPPNRPLIFDMQNALRVSKALGTPLQPRSVCPDLTSLPRSLRTLFSQGHDEPSAPLDQQLPVLCTTKQSLIFQLTRTRGSFARALRAFLAVFWLRRDRRVHHAEES